jgi:hypothetical protein
LNPWGGIKNVSERWRGEVEHGYWAAALQCNRFRAELMRRQPDLLSSLPMSRRHWATLDANVLSKLKPPAYAGQEGHVHLHEDHLTTHLSEGHPHPDRIDEIVNFRREHGELTSFARRLTDAATTTTSGDALTARRPSSSAEFTTRPPASCASLCPGAQLAPIPEEAS